MKTAQFKGHSTGITDCCLGPNQLWTSSADNSVILYQLSEDLTSTVSQTQILHPYPVKALLAMSTTTLEMPYLVTGCSDEGIRLWDTTAVEDNRGPPDLIRTVDAHSHEISAIGLWLKSSDKGRGEPWIVSASLDGTLRKWRLADLLAHGKVASLEPSPEALPMFSLTEEEERELLDLE